MFIDVRLMTEIQSLEALDVFGMLKESTVNSLAEMLTDRKVDRFFATFILHFFICTHLSGYFLYLPIFPVNTPSFVDFFKIHSLREFRVVSSFFQKIYSSFYSPHCMSIHSPKIG